MDHFLRVPLRSVLFVVGLAVSLSLVAAACGGADEAVSTDTASDTESAPASESETGSAAPEPAEPAESDPSASADGQTDGEVAADPAADSHSFPDLATTNIADGSTINLADQLAGGGTPVLLWFFAPH
jgi:hypothetical protein